ncbi:MAG: hypothetical protein FRX49_12497 [Trebouxia sp. A1-2]|nr:MAG: hypothetical protein FRX49_12497 [Trebouxia sp. A1-2]
MAAAQQDVATREVPMQQIQTMQSLALKFVTSMVFGVLALTGMYGDSSEDLKSAITSLRVFRLEGLPRMPQSGVDMSINEMPSKPASTDRTKPGAC